MDVCISGLVRKGIIPICVLVISSWTLNVAAKSTDRSDLNNDNIIDTLDLEIFSHTYLGQNWETVDWCTFYESSSRNKKYFRKLTADKTKRYKRLLKFIADYYDCRTVTHAKDKSDLNKDSNVDSLDLILFSTRYLEAYWESVDWCLFHESTLDSTDFEGRRTKYFQKHFHQLLSFINDHFNCGGSEPPSNALQVEDTPKYLARIADAPTTSDYYITDPIVGALFIYDVDLVLKAEIKGLNRPLGVAVDSQGYILIGNDGRDNIEAYDPASGELLAVFGEGLVKMPTAITTDSFGNIYVTDSLSNNVQVFDSAYRPVRVIGKTGVGESELDFPVDTEIILWSGASVANMQEVFVADQGNRRIQVYDLEGNWLRSIVYLGTCGWFSCTSPPFTRVQAMDVDAQGRLHVLDNFAASVMTFNPADGTFLGSYGEYGTGAGFLRVPMDVLNTETDKAIVIPGEGDRIEVFTVP